MRNSLIADTLYGLAEYLFYVSEKDALETHYFLGGTIPLSIANKLPKVWRFTGADVPQCGREKLRFRIRLMWLNIRKILFTNLYAQDHLFFASPLINWKHYVLIDDAPGSYTAYEHQPLIRPYSICGIKNIFWEWLFRGPIGGKRLGTNRFCCRRFVTDRRDLNASILKDKPVEIVDLHNLWGKAGEDKRAFIKHVFSIPDSVLGDENRIDTLILTQPVVLDCGLSDEECAAIWRPYVEGRTKVMFKRHPRDLFDYKKYFPSAQYFESSAPLQILCAMGLKVNRAVTINSTAVSAFGSDTEVIKIGVDVNKKLSSYYRK